MLLRLIERDLRYQIKEKEGGGGGRRRRRRRCEVRKTIGLM